VCEFNSTKSEIDVIIEDLELAIKICSDCDSSDEDYKLSYPYAAGYSRASMMRAVDNLRRLM